MRITIPLVSTLQRENAFLVRFRLKSLKSKLHKYLDDLKVQFIVKLNVIVVKKDTGTNRLIVLLIRDINLKERLSK